MSTLSILGTRRFQSAFWTQLLGAFNDNLFKNALVLLVAYRTGRTAGLSADQIVALSGAAFILPFFLLSATAGQVADKFEKARVIVCIKVAEIAIMAFAAWGFWLNHVGLLMGALFLMGAQSAFFGPVKYAILPQLVDEDDLVAANGLFGLGTFLAILGGTIIGGLLMAQGDVGRAWVSAGIIGVAIAGCIASLRIPRCAAGDPHTRIDRNPLRPMGDILRGLRTNRTVFLSALGVSWFWFFGAVFLALLPPYCRTILHSDETVVTLFLACFSIGIGVGSLLCTRLSRQRLELGIVPIGSVGMSVFALDLFLMGTPWTGISETEPYLSAAAFLAQPGAWRILIDLVLLAISSGVYAIPLYTLIQQRSDDTHRSRIIAGNNILNALLMVAAGILVAALFALELSIPTMFLFFAFLNVLVAVYIYTVIPEFLFRFVCWMIANVMYRLRHEGREHIPAEGACVLVCNHVTLIDWLVISSVCKRPVRFIMHYKFLQIPLAGPFFRDAKVIPIASGREAQDVMEDAFDRVAEELEQGQIVCIFPEGRLTSDGEMQQFRRGIERIVERTPVPVVPMALRGMWGSAFSRKYERVHDRFFKRFWSKIQLVIAAPLAPEQVTADGLSLQVAELRGAVA